MARTEVRQGAAHGERRTAVAAAGRAGRHRGTSRAVAPVPGWLRALAVVATVTMFLVVVAGALVTATGSGEGCGRSWPLCGSPVWTVQAVIEFSHRVVSGVAALVVVALAWVAPRRLGGRRDARWLAGVAVAFLFLQAGLGAGVVLWGQSDAVLALHFGISLVSFASVALLGLRVWRAASSPAAAPAPSGSAAGYGNGADAGPAGGRRPGDGVEPPDRGHDAGAGAAREVAAIPVGWRRAVWGLLAYTYGVVYTGAYVRHTQTSLACPAWPHCGAPWEGAAAIQMAHRLAAGLLVLAVVAMAVAARRVARRADGRPLRSASRAAGVTGTLVGPVAAAWTNPAAPRGALARGLAWAAVLAVLQALSGAYVVLSRLDLPATMLHSSLMALLFTVLCHVALEVAGPGWSVAAYGQPAPGARAGGAGGPGRAGAAGEVGAPAGA